MIPVDPGTEELSEVVGLASCDRRRGSRRLPLARRVPPCNTRKSVVSVHAKGRRNATTDEHGFTQIKTKSMPSSRDQITRSISGISSSLRFPTSNFQLPTSRKSVFIRGSRFSRSCAEARQARHRRLFGPFATFAHGTDARRTAVLAGASGDQRERFRKQKIVHAIQRLGESDSSGIRVVEIQIGFKEFLFGESCHSFWTRRVFPFDFRAGSRRAFSNRGAKVPRIAHQ